MVVRAHVRYIVVNLNEADWETAIELTDKANEVRIIPLPGTPGQLLLVEFTKT